MMAGMSPRVSGQLMGERTSAEIQVAPTAEIFTLWAGCNQSRRRGRAAYRVKDCTGLRWDFI